LGSLDFPTSLAARRSRKERREAGKRLREMCPRSSHARWQPAADRPDPLDLLEQSSRERIKDSPVNGTSAPVFRLMSDS
jgi:hypothetical protein